MTFQFAWAGPGETTFTAAHEREAIVYAEIDLLRARNKHVIRVPGKHEIDRFRDRRLVLCEVELPSEDVDPPIPRWLAREMVREVTALYTCGPAGGGGAGVMAAAPSAES